MQDNQSIERKSSPFGNKSVILNFGFIKIVNVWPVCDNGCKEAAWFYRVMEGSSIIDVWIVKMLTLRWGRVSGYIKMLV